MGPGDLIHLVSQTLLASSLFALITGTTFAFVGYRLSRRPAPKAGRLAAAGFVVFWYGIALSTFLGPTGLQAFLAAFDYQSLGFVQILSQINFLAISVALWGILYYLIYLYTGWHRAWIPLAVFYAGFYMFLQYFIWDARPVGVHTERWQVALDYEKDIESAGLANPILLALVIGLLVPQILAALAYFTLVFRVRSATQRYRILLVSLSIFVWFASPLVAISLLGPDAGESDTYQLFSRFIGLGAAIVIFMAYYPPGFMRRRFGVQSLSDEHKGRDVAPADSGLTQKPPQTGFHPVALA